MHSIPRHFAMAVLLAISAYSGQAAQRIPRPSRADLEQLVGAEVAARGTRLAWEASEPPSTNPAIYKVEPSQFNESLLRKIADHFALVGDITPIPQDLVSAPGYWIKEPNPTNTLKWRCVVFSVAQGNVGYYSGDDGYRYDPLTRRHNIRGVPEKEEAFVQALELLPLLNLSTNDLEHRPDGRLKWSSGVSEIGYFDRESNERKRTVKRRDVSFFQRVPGGGTTTGVGDGGQLRIGFVSEGKVSDIECLFRKMVKVGEARPKTSKEIMSDIDRGRAWTWRANVPSSLSISNCAVAYPQGNSEFHQEYVWPFYMLASPDGGGTTLYAPLDW